jgi:glycine cleavage system H lipoate-binding protein
MVALAVLITLAALLIFDYFHSRHAVPAVAVQRVSPPAQAPRALPTFVNGFHVPQNLLFHIGHTWALSESPNLVRVGMDDFASRVFGKVEKIQLPQRGQWVRQGQKIVAMDRDGSTYEMLSPIEGTITDVNEAVAEHPDIARTDPYGEGWLMKVNAPDPKTSFRNLLNGSLARWWTEEAASRLQRRMPGVLAGATAQDGGLAAENLTSALSKGDRELLAHEFFLT